jgi:iron-sulfur cluster assembly accessory protein
MNFRLLFLPQIFYAKLLHFWRYKRMIITEKAAERAKEILADEGKAAWGIRIFIAGESCCGPSYGMDLQEEKMPDDEVIEKDGLKVYMDKDTLTSLTGRGFDYHVGEDGEGFMFTGGPSSSCEPGGCCGSSGGSCGH